MEFVQPRVQAPSEAARDDVFLIKTVINHPMETGLRRDADGAPIPRDIINTFTCRYNDVVVFKADLREAVSANPYLSFYVRAADSGTLQYEWEEDGGAVYKLESSITVRA